MAISAVTRLPWKEIIKVAPEVVFTAKEMWERWSSRSQVPQVDPHDEVRTQIAVVVERLEVLEASEVQQAEVVKQIAEQLQGISTGLEETSRRISSGFWMGAAALGVSCITLLIVVLR